jgi:hypothetical protein
MNDSSFFIFFIFFSDRNLNHEKVAVKEILSITRQSATGRSALAVKKRSKTEEFQGPAWLPLR